MVGSRFATSLSRIRRSTVCITLPMYPLAIFAFIDLWMNHLVWGLAWVILIGLTVAAALVSLIASAAQKKVAQEIVSYLASLGFKTVDVPQFSEARFRGWLVRNNVPQRALTHPHDCTNR